MRYKKITDFEEHKTNPFIEKVIEDIKITRKTQTIKPKGKGQIQMIVDDGGDITGHSAFMRFVEVDEDKFAKLYLSQLCNLWELSKPAIRVFSYILTVLIPKKDTFYFLMERCLEYTGYTAKNSIFTGLSELIDSGIIARSDNHVEYFINPLVVFNGDRVTFAKTYIKKKKELNKNQLSLFEEKETELKEIQNLLD